MSRNIVLVTYDSLRADHCGPWDYERDTTPNLDAMAEDGIVFENAISPASRTNPSMAGTFTGEPLVVRDQVADPDLSRHHLKRHGTLAEELSDAGYATGAFCPNAYASQYYGFDQGFDTFEDFLFDKGFYQRLFDEHVGGSELVSVVRNVRNFIRRQEAFKTWDTYIDQMVEWAQDQEEPFFLWAFSLDTHFPYLTPRTARTWSTLFDQYYYNWRCNQLIDQLDIDISETERQKIVDIYDDSIRFGDVLLAELQDRLSEFDPVVVVHGDHGEAFNERGIYGHFYPSLYEENIHVPLVVSGTDESARVEGPVTLLDLPEIIRRASGLGDGEVSNVHHDWVVATDYDGRNDRNLIAVRTENRKYIVAQDDDQTNRAVYQLDHDRMEAINRSDTDLTAESPLRQLAHRRLQHESELLGLRAATADLKES